MSGVDVMCLRLVQNFLTSEPFVLSSQRPFRSS
nr:MAG TPA: hypothetical protein [Caudoviricetes sp.]